MGQIKKVKALFYINSVKLDFLCFYLLFRLLFRDFLKLGQKYKNIFVHFLVQMKTSKFAFEINWPLNPPQTKSSHISKFPSWPFLFRYYTPRTWYLKGANLLNALYPFWVEYIVLSQRSNFFNSIKFIHGAEYPTREILLAP